MKASNASITSSRFSIAWGFSILAMTGTETPSSAITSRTVSMSAAERTNDSAIMSTPRCSAQRRSARVLVGEGGHGHVHAGQVDALVVADGPRDDDAGDHVGAGDLGRLEDDLPVVDEDAVPGLDVARGARRTSWSTPARPPAPPGW